MRSTWTAGAESAVHTAADFHGPRRIQLPSRVVEPTADEVAPSIQSLSGSAPPLFGVLLPDFDAEMREVLAVAAPRGPSSEQLAGITVDLWP